MESHVSCIIAMQISSCIFCRFQLGGIKFGGRCGSTFPANSCTISGSEFGSIYLFSYRITLLLLGILCWFLGIYHKLGNVRLISIGDCVNNNDELLSGTSEAQNIASDDIDEFLGDC